MRRSFLSIFQAPPVSFDSYASCAITLHSSPMISSHPRMVQGGSMELSRLLRSTLLAGATFTIIALLTLAVQSVAAQTQEPQKASEDVQQLKDRLKQLEQTVQELKSQLS